MNLVTFFFVMVLPFVFGIACQNQRGVQDKWQDIFDGKTLNGWKILGDKDDFYVVDGMIVINGNGYLITEKSYDNFILELDVKINTPLNSGVQCRSHIWKKDTTTTYVAGDREGTIHQVKQKAGSIWGYQIEVDPSSRAWSGGLYEMGNRGWLVTLARNEAARKAFKPMDWNHYKIIMDSNKIQTWVNGVLAVDTTDDMSKSGFLGLQCEGHRGQVDKKVLFKNIKIKEL